MFPPIAEADDILQAIVNIVRAGLPSQLGMLDSFPVATHVTDADGLIKYFNSACIKFAGRRPIIGRDRWCVTWKLYTNEGDFLPHDQCPMAVAISNKKSVRDLTAIAERPNGSRVNFLPFPTPVISERGEMLGAVNMLIDITAVYQRLSRELSEDLRSWQNTLVEQALASFSTTEINQLIEELEAVPRRLH